MDRARTERASGQFDAAILRLRALLRRTPDNLAAREELGYVLLLDQQYAAAQYQFQILLTQTRDPARRALYQAVLNRIVQDRPVGLSLVLAIVPSSNLNRGSDATTLETSLGTLTISDDSRARSGLRTSLGLAGYFRAALGASDRLVFDWSATRTHFSSDAVEGYDDLQGVVTWQHAAKWGEVYLGLGQGDRNADTQSHTREIYRIGGSRVLQQRSAFLFDVTRTEYRYSDDPDASGPETIARMRYVWPLASGQPAWAGLVLEDTDPSRAHQQYSGRVVQAGRRFVLRQGTVIDATYSYGERDFAGIFPAQSFARFDTFHEISISALDSRVVWRGYTPQLTCTARENLSNLTLFTARTAECGVIFTRRF